MLSEHTIGWIEKQGGGDCRFVSATPLKGSISSAVYALRVEQGGKRQEWVLRQFTDADWLNQEPDLADHESAALAAAHSAGLKSPELIAADADGRECGLPSVLMGRLSGRVVLVPDDFAGWLNGLALALAEIHAAPAKAIKWNYFTYNSMQDLEVPKWSEKPEAWGRMIDRVQAPAPAYTPQFIHRDYHPANVLWDQGRVSGVVDWVNACTGPAGIDTGHCRLNLVQMYGVRAADDFLNEYAAAEGTSDGVADPYWDILCLIEMLPGPPEVYRGWSDLGMTGLDPGLIAKRLDAYAESLALKLR